MFREDAEGNLPLTGSARRQDPYHESPPLEADSTFRTPLLKSLLKKDIISFMSRFFVKRFPS